jgi:hypothetical protein
VGHILVRQNPAGRTLPIRVRGDLIDFKEHRRRQAQWLQNDGRQSAFGYDPGSLRYLGFASCANHAEVDPWLTSRNATQQTPQIFPRRMTIL